MFDQFGDRRLSSANGFVDWWLELDIGRVEIGLIHVGRVVFASGEEKEKEKENRAG